jgi:uncharacterized membrane protein
MRHVLSLGFLLALAGCGGEEPGNNSTAPAIKPVPKPMLGKVDLNKPVRASGTGPYWAIHIAPGTIAYSDTPEMTDLTDFYPVSPKLADGRAVFETKTPEAEAVTIILTAQACTAGKQALPLTAEVRIGGRTLRGCAGPAPRLVRWKAEAPESNATVAQ